MATHPDCTEKFILNKRYRLRIIAMEILTKNSKIQYETSQAYNSRSHGSYHRPKQNAYGARDLMKPLSRASVIGCKIAGSKQADEPTETGLALAVRYRC